MTTDEAIADLIIREAGFVDDPNDAGGATKFGITRATLADWRGAPVTVEDVKQLSAGEAASIYRKRYVVDTGFAAIADDALRALLVDSAAQHGPANAVRMLQKALGTVAADGVLGTETVNAVNRQIAPTKLWLDLLGQRIRFYGRIVTDHPAQAEFAAGWANRVADLLQRFVAGE